MLANREQSPKKDVIKAKCSEPFSAWLKMVKQRIFVCAKPSWDEILLEDADMSNDNNWWEGQIGTKNCNFSVNVWHLAHAGGIVGDLLFSIDITIKSNTGKKPLSPLASLRYKSCLCTSHRNKNLFISKLHLCKSTIFYFCTKKPLPSFVDFRSINC